MTNFNIVCGEKGLICSHGSSWGQGQDPHVDTHLICFFKLLRQAVTDCAVINHCPHTLQKVFN